MLGKHLANPEIRLLSIFLTVVESGGFAAAQGTLNISLSTISNHIAALEARLGVTLCKRGRAGFKLTHEGRLIYEEARKLIANAELFEQRVRELRDPLSASISIGITDNTITDENSKISRVIESLYDQSKNIRLRLICRPPNELVQSILKDEIDIAIASFPQIPVGTDYVKLYEERHHFYCHRTHPLFCVPDEKISIDQLSAHRIVGRSYWGERDLNIFKNPDCPAIVSDMESEARLIMSGKFLGYLPSHMAAGYVARKEIRPIKRETLSYSANFFVIKKKRNDNRVINKLFESIIYLHEN